ncbi:MAG: alanine--tRNA ligase [Acutalibacteraceae bacterium]
MDKISSIEIRNKFISFFKEKDHMEITDASIVPKNDPTLLFINSGMAPLKNYFTGIEKPPYPRLCDVQPCIRTIDIDSIGDKHHLTSFQMLGSWSINDYFKEKAISLAYEFLTESLGISQEKLYVTVFAGDEELGLPLDQEAYDFWKQVGMPESHIIACGKEDNFWGPTAETGPCGPCTEIFYDTGEGEKYTPGGEFDTKKRYIEIWNAGVFMQLNKNADGSYSKLGFTSVDTGAGLERLAMVLNNYDSAYQTDLLLPIKEKILEKLPSKDSLSEIELRIITDHLRTAALILSEHVSPSNEGRGYIPRKLIRRCMMITAKNKIKNFDFSEIVEFITEKYKEIFPKFSQNKNYIISEFKKEESQFSKVVTKGLSMLEKLKDTEKKISGKEAFELVTTYGLPFDIVKQYAEENSMIVDEKDYILRIEHHKEKSKNSSSNNNTNDMKIIFDQLSDIKSTEFLGYENFECDSCVLKIFKDNIPCNTAHSGEEIKLISDKTVFYAVSGGQCADTGIIKGNDFEIQITDVQKTSENVYVHSGVVISGTIRENDIVHMTIDKEKRINIQNNHTAVHLLQSALQKIYGKNLHQAGSKVECNKLRFDFNYDHSINYEDICKIESIVNSYIRENIPRKVEVKSLEEAMKSGAMALFESKYGEYVRIVSYGDVSAELCGGTHTGRTGNIGLFVILAAEGIGKGLKRITAITGESALKYVQNKIEDVNNVASVLKVKSEDILEKVKNIISKKPENKSSENSLNDSKFSYITGKSGTKIGYQVIETPCKKLQNEIIKASDKLKCIVICVISGEKNQVILAVNDENLGKFAANDMLSALMSKIDGKGGGNKKVATGGSKISADKIIGFISEL